MGWFFGMQNSTYPLMITIFINIVNIVLSYYFVKIANLGVEGVAYGTLIAQYSGLILSIFLLLRYKTTIKKAKLKDIFHYHQLLDFIHVNKNIFIRTLSLTFVLAFFYSQSAKDSQETLAIMILLLQFLIWFSFSIDGIAYATESLVGKYYGAKNWTKFYKAIRYSFYWSLGFTLLYMILYYKGAKELLELYTNQTNLIDKSIEFLPWIVLMPIISFGAFIWDGVFIGMTAVKSMRNSVLLSMVLFLTIFYTTKEYNFIYSLWISFLLFFAFRGLIQTFLFLKYKTKLR
jgi:MATE family multidrug resistance protein